MIHGSLFILRSRESTAENQKAEGPLVLFNKQFARSTDKSHAQQFLKALGGLRKEQSLALIAHSCIIIILFYSCLLLLRRWYHLVQSEQRTWLLFYYFCWILSEHSGGSWQDHFPPVRCQANLSFKKFKNKPPHCHQLQLQKQTSSFVQNSRGDLAFLSHLVRDARLKGIYIYIHFVPGFIS